MSKVSLKEHLNSRIDEVKDSVKTAYDAMDKRLESMNEFRAQLREQTATFINRATFDLLQQQVNDLKESRASLEGKASQKSVEALKIISVISVIIAALSIILRFF